MRFGEPFFTKKRITFILRRVILPFAIIYIGVATIATIRDMTIENDEYAAVLLSDYALWEYDYRASPCAFPGSYIPWTYYFNNQNMRVKWFFGAKSADPEKVIRDPKCQSIVLVGHGSKNCWQATDAEVSNIEVAKMMHGVSKKKGEWLQLSCGVEDIFPVKMGALVMEDDKVYTYNNAVTTYVFVADAILGFRYLKHRNR